MRRVLGIFFLLLAGAVGSGWVVTGVRRRTWESAQATVLEVRPVRNPNSDGYDVRARLLLPDGRAIEGFSQDSHPARSWAPGSTRPAWFDPADPQSFTLAGPPGRGGESGRAMVVVAFGLLGAVGAALVLL